MVRLIGIFLIVTGVIVLASVLIHIENSNNFQITGNVISNIIEQPDVKIGFSDYLEGIMLSYSIISMIVGVIFLVRF